MQDDNDQELIKSEIHINQFQEGSQKKVYIGNMAKLTHDEILLQKNSKIVLRQLPVEERLYSIDSFLIAKESYEKGIAKFKTGNSVDEIVTMGRQRKRTYSIDNISSGAYFLYNWISSDQYPCEKPPPQERIAHVIYQILGMRWHKALSLLRNVAKTLETSTLEFVLRGFQTIQALIGQESQYYQDHFMSRSTFPITFKNSSLDSIGGSFAFINIFEEDSKNKFKEIKATPRKVECLKMNLDYLANFASKYKVKNGDDYLVLAFKLLGNIVDQNELHADSQKQMGKILANLNLKIYDRLNFATKLLPEKKRKFFCNELENTLPTFPRLDNILYYLPANNKVKEVKIDRICMEYLDQYGDIETVAYLSLDYPFLRKYYRQYKQLLQFSNQNKQLEKLENFRDWTDKEEKWQLDAIKNTRMTSFFDCINLTQEKIYTNEVKVMKQVSCLCQICDKKVQRGDGYLFCGKCRHGGHPLHLLKWFEECQSCPHIGCPCTCN